MNIETLKSLTGWKRPTVNPTPTDLEIALARIHSDHTTAMVAIKLLTESVQANSTGNLNMVLAQQERHQEVLKTVRELKKEVTSSDSRHLAAYELSVRPLARAMDTMAEKIKELDASVHAMHMNIGKVKTELAMDREAQARIQNTKLNAIAIRIDALTKILARSLIKHPEGVTVAPPKKVKDPTVPAKKGRPEGRKSRTLKERRDWLMNRIQKSRPDKTMLAKYQSQLNEVLTKMAVPK